MSIGTSFMRMIGIEDSNVIDDISEEEIEREKERIAKQQKKNKAGAGAPAADAKNATIAEDSKSSGFGKERRFTVTGTHSFKLILIEPRAFEECPKLVDSLKSKKPVIINLESLEVETAKKIFDFLSGATYALDGRVQKVANNIFIFAPANVDIAGGIQEDGPAFDFDKDHPTLTSDSPWGGK